MKKNFFLGAIVTMLLIASIAVGWKTFSTNETKTSFEASNVPLDDLEVAFEISTIPEYVAVSPDQLYTLSDVVLTGWFVKENKTLAISGSVFTQATIKVDQVIKGTLTDQQMKKGMDNVIYAGGEVLLDDYLNSLDPERLNNPKAGPLPTKEERKSKKIVEKVAKQANKDKNTKEKLLIFLNYDEKRNLYFVGSDAYSMLKIDKGGNVFSPDTKTFDKVDFYPVK